MFVRRPRRKCDWTPKTDSVLPTCCLDMFYVWTCPVFGSNMKRENATPPGLFQPLSFESFPFCGGPPGLVRHPRAAVDGRVHLGTTTRRKGGGGFFSYYLPTNTYPYFPRLFLQNISNLFFL